MKSSKPKNTVQCRQHIREDKQGVTTFWSVSHRINHLGESHLVGVQGMGHS